MSKNVNNDVNMNLPTGRHNSNNRAKFPPLSRALWRMLWGHFIAEDCRGHCRGALHVDKWFWFEYATCEREKFCFLLLGRRSSACTFDSLACVWAFVCFAPVYLNISLPFLRLLLFDMRASFELLLKFRNVLNVPRTELSFLAYNQNIKEDIHTALEVLLCFALKRNETT